MSTHTANLAVSRLAALTLLLLAAAPPVWSDALDDEFTFAAGLVEWGLPDWSFKVLDAVEREHPDQAGRVKVVRAEGLLAQRKLAEVEVILKGMKPDDPKADAIRLATANYYYRIGDVPKAKELYNAFFARFKTVPTDPDLLRNYLDSSYRFAKMLEMAGDLPGTAAAYERLISAKPEREVLRRVQSDLSQLQLRQARAEPDAGKKTALLDKSWKLCEAIQWGGTDIWFGQSIVTMANVALARGDRAGAQKLLKQYDEILKEIDVELKKVNATGESPMAAVRYMRGELAQQDAKALKGVAGKEKEAIALYAQALKDLLTVFKEYGGSDQAPEAGLRIAEITESLKKDYGKTPKIDWGEGVDKVVDTQLRLANNLYRNKQFAEAAAEYLKAINMFPTAGASVRAMGTLIMCYGELKDDRMVRALTGYTGERFAGNATAASVLLSTGNFFRDRGATNLYFEAYETFLASQAKHELAGSVLFALYVARKKAGDEPAGLVYLDRLVKDHPQDQYFPKALTLIAFSRYSASNYLGAIDGFRLFLKETQPSPDQALAQFSLADCHVRLEEWTNAVTELEKLIGWLAPKDNPYATTPDQRAKNQSLLEKSVFQRANCFTRMKEPADQVPALREKALKGYEQFLTLFPTSSLAPMALNGRGQVQLELGQRDAAVKTFEDLAKKYPQSEVGKNALYTMARAALEIGQVQMAKEAFDKMVAQAAQYKPDEFVRLGQLFLDKGAWTEAVAAFSYVQDKTQERVLLERTLYGLGKANYELKKYDEAVKGMDLLMKTYPSSGLFYDAKFVLGESFAALGKTPEAVAAIAEVMKVATEPALRTRAIFKLAEINEAGKQPEKAFALYQQLALLSDPNKLELRPLIEQSLVRGVALGLELKRYKDVEESCDQFLQLFGSSAKVEEIRAAKAQARLKASEAAP